MKKLVTLGGVLAVVVVAVWYLNPLASTSTGVIVEVTRTDEGYSPAEVTINVGDTVVFKNESSEFHWPASDLHPTHGIYPEFDPLKPVGPTENWSFTFTKVGEWRYHDHLRANKTGVIIVVE